MGVLCTGVGVLRTMFPKRPLCSKKCFPAYFIKYTEYRLKNFTGRAWLYPESAADLYLVISKTCWLQKVPILKGGRLRQVSLLRVSRNGLTPRLYRHEDFLSNTVHFANVGSMLGQHRRRWPDIKTASGECLVLVVSSLVIRLLNQQHCTVC